MHKLLILAPLLVLLASCGESSPSKTTTEADAPSTKVASSEAPKTEVDTPPAMMRVEYYEISKK